MKTRSAAPFLALTFTLVLFAPLGWLGVRAFGGEATSEAAEALGAAGVLTLLANSITVAALTAGFAVLIAWPAAVLVGRFRFAGSAYLWPLFVLPLVIPPHIHAIAWARVLGNQGWLTGWLQSSFNYELNWRAGLFDSFYFGPALVMGCAYFPLVFFVVRAGFHGLSAEAVESARLAAGRRAAWTAIMRPLLLPRLWTGALFVFLLALSTYPVVSLLDTPTLIQKVQFHFAARRQETGAILAIPLVLVGAVVVAALAYAERRVIASEGLRSYRPQALHGGAGLLALGGVLALVGIANAVPLVSLIREAGGFSTDPAVADNYQSVFSRGGIQEAVFESMGSSFAAAVLMVGLAYLGARALQGGRARMLESFALASLAVPPVVVGVAILLFWAPFSGDSGLPFAFVAGVGVALFALAWWLSGGGRPLGAGIVTLAWFAWAYLLPASGGAQAMWEGGIGMVLMGWTARFLVFPLRMLRQSFGALDPAADEVARVHGAGGMARFLQLEWPRMRPALGGALVLGFVLCFTELASWLLTQRPGLANVQARIFNMVHYRSIGEVCALCVMTIVIALVPIIALRLLWPAPRKEGS